MDRHAMDSKNTIALQVCIREVEDLSTPQENDRVALEGLIRSLAELIGIRSQRIGLMENKVSPYLIGVLAVTSLVFVTFFFVFDSRELNAAHFVIPSLTFLFAFFTVMLIDLTQPFFGYWHVRTRDFEELRGEFRPYHDDFRTMAVTQKSAPSVASS
jgi:hypothetical protein